jgi:SEC-C motif
MGPDDPVFFDPDADEPVPIPEEKLADIYAVMAEHGFDEEWMEQRRLTLEEEGAVRRVGRNDPCPCGSGLKYKRCCGR